MIKILKKKGSSVKKNLWIIYGKIQYGHEGSRLIMQIKYSSKINDAEVIYIYIYIYIR